MAARLPRSIALGAFILCQAALADAQALPTSRGGTHPVLEAGLAAFDAHHALAPAVGRLQFRRIARTGYGERGFTLPLGANGSHRRQHVTPDIRTPGLPANQRRLGDLRLECKVTAAMARAEMPQAAVAAIDSILTANWCGFFNEKQNARLGYEAERLLRAAVLREGKWSLDLKPKGAAFEVPVGSPHWSDEAIIELSYAEPPTGTAGGKPRTGP